MSARLDAIHVEYVVTRYYDRLCDELVAQRGEVEHHRGSPTIPPDVHDAAMLAILEAVREGRANDPNDELWDYLIDRAYASEEWLDGQGVLERLAEVEASEVRYYPHHRRGTHLGRPRWQREIAEDILSCAGRGDFTGLYAVLDAVPKDVARNVLVGIRQKGIDVQYVPSRRASQRALRSRQFRDNRDEFVADLRSRLDDALWNTAMSEAQASIDQEDAADRTRRLTRERVQRHRQNRPE